jgi:hypothetical protein
LCRYEPVYAGVCTILRTIMNIVCARVCIHDLVYAVVCTISRTCAHAHTLKMQAVHTHVGASCMEKGRQHKEKNRHGAASGPQQAGEEIDEIFDFLLVALLVVSVTPFAARPPLSAAVQNLRRHEQAEVEVLADILKSERPSIFTLRSDYRAVLFENLCRVLGAQVVA